MHPATPDWICTQIHGVFQPDGKVALLSWVNSHTINMLLKKHPLEVRFEAQMRGSTEKCVLLSATWKRTVISRADNLQEVTHSTKHFVLRSVWHIGRQLTD